MDDFLRQVSADLRSGKKRRASVRTLLREAGFRRRGTEVVKFVRQKLKKHGLRTLPDFADAEMDAQVSFEIVAGSSPAKQGEKAASAPEIVHGRAALKSLSSSETVLSWRSGYRVLFRDFATYVAALKRLQSDGKVTVTGKGQNRYRQDRDAFAFFIAVDRRHQGADLTSKEHDYLVRLVKELGESGAPEPTDEREETGPVGQARTVDLSGLEARVLGRLGEGLADLRGTLETAMDGLREELQQKVEELRHDSIRKLAALQNADEFGKLIEEEHARYASELQKREDLVREHEEEIIRLSAQLEELEADLTQGLVDSDPEEAFPTMEATLRLFEELGKGSPIRILPSAFDSAQKSSCKRRREVLRFLLALKELAEGLYVRGEQAGPLKDWFQRRGYEYAPKDSETTTSKHGAEREFLSDGVKVRFEEHATLFPNTPDCTQVYFRRDAERRELVVGYVGNHLRIVSR